MSKLKPDVLGFLEDAKGTEVRLPLEYEGVVLDHDDFLLLAMLQDPIYCPELLWTDPGNRDYGGLYRVRDYQYKINRAEGNYVGFACARSVGKTEGEKVKAMTHPFRRNRENLLITAPELIHLLPLTDFVEQLIRDCRLTREFLDTRAGKTGFTHRPFQVDFIDGTKIVGRIPRREGTGVKGQHQPDLIIEEAQDYPEKGWTEVHETVMKDRPDFQYHFYGVHSGDRTGGFHESVSSGEFKIVQVTAIERPGWSAREKAVAKARYGGTSSPDYRRNILGEAGSAASAFFVLARLFACMDQDRESDYNTREYRAQGITAEQFEEYDMPIADLLDLPAGYRKVWAGMDVGLAQSPTVISLWAIVRVKNVDRLTLIRRFTLERLRTPTIIEAWLAIGRFYGAALQGFGIDSTGLGYPILQSMEDHETAPKHLKDRTRGYFFNSNVEVHVEKANVIDEGFGRMKDQFGTTVKELIDPFTQQPRYVTYMPMIEASTRYIREWVDSGFMRLPFDPEVARDMQAETKQRIERLAGVKTKPDAFHILDSFRAMAMVFHAERIEAALAFEEPGDVLDYAPAMY